MKSSAGPGETFRWRSLLARGPEAESYLASAAGEGRGARLVVKVLSRADGRSWTDVFRRDALVLASLAHPSLAEPVRFVRDAPRGRALVARSYVEGSDLAAAAAGMPPGKLLPWLLAAAEAVGLLHRFGLLHRNIKASNFIVPGGALTSRRGREARVVLCDPAWWPEARGAGGGAPEVRDGGRATFSSDLYALGAVFYRLLTGKDGRAGASGFPPAPSEIRPEVPVDLDRLVLKLLGPEPARRYQEARAVIEDLSLLAGPTGVRSPAMPECFVGREREIEAAVRALEGQGRPSVFAVTAEAGLGKSAFLRRLALEAQVRGLTTASVRCYPGDGAPMAPLRELMRRIVPAGQAGRALRARARALLDGGGGGEAPSAAGEPAAFRRALVRGLTDCILEAARRSANRLFLLVDEVHFADSLTVDLLAALVREATAPADERDAGAAAPHLALSFRSESPFRAGLKPLLDALELASPRRVAIDLEPLAGDAVGEWLDLALQDQPEARERARSAVHGGNPFAVREAVRLGAFRGQSPPAASDLPRMHIEYLEALGPDERSACECLAAIGRPAAADLIARTLSFPATRARQAVRSLVRDGTLAEEGDLVHFRHGSFLAWLQEAVPAGEAASLHGRIAAALEERGEGSSEEIARHWLRSDVPRKGIARGLAAARRLAAAHEDRRALELYEALLGVLPPSRSRLRRAASEEAADACSRLGQHRRSIERLERLLQEGGAGLEAGRLHAKLGVSHHRAGEVEEGAFHLEKSLKLLEGGRGRAWLRERLRAKSELAEIASNRGRYEEAERLSLGALDEAARAPAAARDAGTRRARMVLLETLAHLRLRRFQYREARGLFEESLGISEDLGALSEQGLILNNLGILHNQENELDAAVACYERAAKLSSRLGEDLILANIHSNLALLHAKRGEPEAADDALRRAARHDARSDSARARFLRLHCAGIVDLYLGRYASGIGTFREAVTLGEDLKDAFLTAFDLVYLAECHLHRGEMKPAEGALDRASSLDAPPPEAVTAMIAARRAALAALGGAGREARAALAARRERPSGGIPFLEAWDGVYAGWASRIAGLHDEARVALEAARAFFARVKAPAGEIHAALEIAALDADLGNMAAARKRLDALRARFTCGRGPLRSPMLSARLLLYRTRVLAALDDSDAREATALLVEAESFLIGRSLRDLEALARDLRRGFRLAGADGRARSPLPPEPARDPAAGLEIVRSFQGAAVDLVRRFEDRIGEEGVRSLQRHLRDLEDHIAEVQRAAEGGEPRGAAPFRAGSIIGRSKAVREVIRWIRHVAPSKLPVLVTGETGTGKEVVARAVHGESPRAAGPFVTLNCAALPGELLEAELFGSRKGAFTGAEADRDGLLAAARGGTVFFDEVGEMPLALQAKLLRVLDRGRVRPLGGAEEVEVDARFVLATNRDLRALVAEGAFRADLFFRIGAVEISVPPLRERLEDLPLLVERFHSLAVASDSPRPFLQEGAMQVLLAYSWPGNVRELQNLVTHLALALPGPVTAEDVRAVLGRGRAEGVFSPGFLRSRPLARLLEDLEREYIVQLRADHGGDLKAAARALGVSLQALYKKLKKLGIRPRDGGAK
jgi:DNA-binding NtrC family response regulator/tetratricopeptide (TPR) repeat protein